MQINSGKKKHQDNETILRMGFFRVFSATDGVCPIPVNIPFIGDLTIHVSHAPVGLSFQAHV